MRVLLQRVSEAQVRVDKELIGQCGAGLLVLVCAMQGDTEAQADKLAADLIVVGSHTRSGLALLLGSTARGLVPGAHCDVLAVKVDQKSS